MFFRASDVGDTLAIGLNQPFRGIIGDLEFVRLDAGNLVVGIGGIHHHHRIIAERGWHARNAIRHLRIEETVHAIPFQRGDFVLFARPAIGADRDDHVPVGACRVLRAQNDAACVRRGGNFLADEAENSRAASAQAARQRIDRVAEFVAFSRTSAAKGLSHVLHPCR